MPFSVTIAGSYHPSGVLSFELISNPRITTDLSWKDLNILKIVILSFWLSFLTKMRWSQISLRILSNIFCPNSFIILKSLWWVHENLRTALMGEAKNGLDYTSRKESGWLWVVFQSLKIMGLQELINIDWLQGRQGGRGTLRIRHVWHEYPLG